MAGRLEVSPPSVELETQLESDGTGKKILETSFMVRNLGGRSVAITRIERSCGCTEPVLRPTSSVKTGRAVELFTKIVPPNHGDRLISLVLHTDSPITPRVLIPIHVRTLRKPPFLATASGDLIFRSVADAVGGRAIDVTGLVDSEDDREPLVECDIPNAVIRKTRRTDSMAPQAYGDSSIQRTWTFHLAFPHRTHHDTDYLGGYVRFQDPWHTDLPPIAIGVTVIPSPRLVVVPERIILRQSQREATLLVRDPDGTNNLAATSSTAALEITRDEVRGNDYLMFRIKRRTDQPLELGSHEIKVFAPERVPRESPRIIPIRVVGD